MPGSRRIARSLAVLSLCVAGCPARASVLFDVHTDLVPGVELDEVVLRTPTEMRSFAAVSGDWLAGVRLGPLDAPEGLQPLSVEARLRGGEVVAATVRASVRGTVVVPIWLLRACAEIDCPPADDPTRTECREGRCVRPDCEPGTDGCPIPCATDVECDAPPAACARAACRDGHCVDEPIAGACPAGSYCDAALGCTAFPFDGGAPDGGSIGDAGSSDAPDGGCASRCDDLEICTIDSCAADGGCFHDRVSDPDGEDEPSVCEPGSHCCDGRCTDRLSDANHCGGCGWSCRPGESCVDGVCTCDGGPRCTFPLICCPTHGCVDLDSNRESCGLCNIYCMEAWGDCIAGDCTCGGGPQCLFAHECCHCPDGSARCVRTVDGCTCP